jgi:hypothetical protein
MEISTWELPSGDRVVQCGACGQKSYMKKGSFRNEQLKNFKHNCRPNLVVLGR